ncbi:hypothetical protein [Blastococcus sp. Marseille-P5729]|uniref:hypothetical protein n=1 Tax=Blastococcus sp. Marseille-P5729 TaxID=2086582 RepID=UPI00131E6BD0|nr:hypothetical protein [Blastococcus sp. Marseille-P5729]
MSGSTAGLLAAWASAYLQEQVSLDDVLDRVLGHKRSVVLQAGAPADRAPWEEPGQTVELVPAGQVATLGELLLGLRRLEVDRLHACFPIAGDAGGIGPGPALAPAYDAGNAAIVPDIGLVIVPTGEDDAQIELTVYPSRATAQYVSVGEAAMELTEALHRSTSILTDLDVASWNPRLGRVSRKALDEVAAHELPAECPPRATHLLVRAHQIETLLATAAIDPGGGSVNSYEARARDAALAPLRRHVARALTAAYNSLPYAT